MTAPTDDPRNTRASLVHDFRKVGVMVLDAPNRDAALTAALEVVDLDRADVEAYTSNGPRSGQWYIEFSTTGVLDPSYSGPIPASVVGLRERGGL